MTSISLLKHMARALSPPVEPLLDRPSRLAILSGDRRAAGGGLLHTQALRFVARKAGFDSFEAARATLPEREADLVPAGAPVRVIPDAEGIAVEAGRYRAILPLGAPRSLLLAHAAWLTGAPAYWAAAAAREDRVRDLFSRLEDDGQPIVLDRSLLEPSLAAWRSAVGAQAHRLDMVRREAARRAQKPLRAPVRLWLDAESEPQADVPLAVVHHSPTGWGWGYTGSGAADLALNILAAYVPPFADGLPAMLYPYAQHAASAAADHAHHAFAMEVIARVPPEGGEIQAAWIDKAVRLALSDLAERAASPPLRCSDDLTYFAWAPPPDWLQEITGRAPLRPAAAAGDHA